MSTELLHSVDATVAPMADTEPQTAAGKVLWQFTMSLDGFVAGPNHAMDWMTGISFRPGLVQEYVETTGAVLGGRDGFNAGCSTNPGGRPSDSKCSAASLLRYRWLFGRSAGQRPAAA